MKSVATMSAQATAVPCVRGRAAVISGPGQIELDNPGGALDCENAATARGLIPTLRSSEHDWLTGRDTGH